VVLRETDGECRICALGFSLASVRTAFRHFSFSIWKHRPSTEKSGRLLDKRKRWVFSLRRGLGRSHVHNFQRLKLGRSLFCLRTLTPKFGQHRLINGIRFSSQRTAAPGALTSRRVFCANAGTGYVFPRGTIRANGRWQRRGNTYPVPVFASWDRRHLAGLLSITTPACRRQRARVTKGRREPAVPGRNTIRRRLTGERTA
jgi:hypothetical protein